MCRIHGGPGTVLVLFLVLFLMHSGGVLASPGACPGAILAMSSCRPGAGLQLLTMKVLKSVFCECPYGILYFCGLQLSKVLQSPAN